MVYRLDSSGHQSVNMFPSCSFGCEAETRMFWRSSDPGQNQSELQRKNWADVHGCSGGFCDDLWSHVEVESALRRTWRSVETKDHRTVDVDLNFHRNNSKNLLKKAVNESKLWVLGTETHTGIQTSLSADQRGTGSMDRTVSLRSNLDWRFCSDWTGRRTMKG